jgi:hypothetical protein
VIPDNHLTVQGQELRDDTKEFLNEVLISLFRILSDEGLSSKDCNFLGTNDIVVFRASEAMVVIFSRAIKDYAVRLVEVTGDGPTEADDDRGQTQDEDDLETPQYYEDREAMGIVKQTYGLVDPVAIIFPLNYLTLEGQEKENAAEAVAELLVEPTKVDVDRKNRIVRVNPIFQSRTTTLRLFMGLRRAGMIPHSLTRSRSWSFSPIWVQGMAFQGTVVPQSR